MRYVNPFVAVLFLFVYLSVYVPPKPSFDLWIVTFAVPFVIVVNLVLVVLFAALRKRTVFYYLVPLLFTYNFLVASLGVKGIFGAYDGKGKSFAVSSYNVSGLRLPKRSNPIKFGFANDKDSLTYKIRSWILANDADIQCYQEFYYNKHNNYFKTIEALRNSGMQCAYHSRDSSGRPSFGLLIASKFPIIRHGMVVVGQTDYNGVMYADLLVTPNDTLRVMNVHLESMEMKRHNPTSEGSIDEKASRIRTILSKLRNGVLTRKNQVEILLEAIERSPYPVICAGDFNELPYSYSYQLLARRMTNAFEEEGKGFGFTYNGKTLQMLRIDNHFFTEGLHVRDFETLKLVTYSDHFPTLAHYSLGD